MVKVIKEKFVVIGKEGSTLDGEGFIQKLWDDANSHFSEVAHLAKKDANGGIVGIWGAMSDISRSFKPWEDGFSKAIKNLVNQNGVLVVLRLLGIIMCVASSVTIYALVAGKIVLPLIK